MSIDVPIVVYGKDESRVTKKEMDDLSEQWYKKNRKSAVKGEKINLNDYLKQKI